MSNFENQVRVPMLVRVPWIQEMVGKHTSALVELVDLFPTLTGLAKVSHAETALEGYDFSPVLHVSRHDIAGIWVAFFSRRQRYRC